MFTLILLNQDISNLISDWHDGNQSKWQGSLSLDNIILEHFKIQFNVIYIADFSNLFTPCPAKNYYLHKNKFLVIIICL